MPSFRATLFYLIISYKQGLQSSIYQKLKKTAIYSDYADGVDDAMDEYEEDW